MAPTIGTVNKAKSPHLWDAHSDPVIPSSRGAHSDSCGTGACQRRGMASILPPPALRTSRTVGSCLGCNSTGAGAGGQAQPGVRGASQVSKIMWGPFPSPGPAEPAQLRLSRTQTLPGFARETGNFCPAASLGGFRHGSWGTGKRSQAAARLSVLTALLKRTGRGASLGLGESFRNNSNKQPAPTTVTVY